jgi:hypothetical protein
MGTQKMLYQKEDNTIFIGQNITVIFKSKQNMTSKYMSKYTVCFKIATAEQQRLQILQ